jgi:hypothetical protein
MEQVVRIVQRAEPFCKRVHGVAPRVEGESVKTLTLL